jgi:dynein light intermediate chain 1
MASGSEAPAPLRNPFVFHHKPNTLDRDRIVVPAGWDSWGKIGVLREGFEAKVWGEAWEADLDADVMESEDHSGAKKLYKMLVPDQGAKVKYVILVIWHKNLIFFGAATPFTSI